MRISDWSSDVCSSDLVRLLWRGDNRISITPFKPLPEPKGLASIKSEIGQRWPMTGLLDVLKEAALDTGLMDAFETSASRVTLSKAALAQRLLLCLYGLGTNAGLKRVAGATPRSEEHTSELQSLMRISYAVFCLKK